VFTSDHTHGTIYSPPHVKEHIRTNGWNSLSLFPTDQIWFVPLLADRNAVLLHSAAAILNGQGLIFVGHSEAGKSAITRLLIQQCRSERSEESPSFNDETLRTDQGDRGAVEILCDDRNIVRRWPEGWRVHGTWSHGDVADVSSASAPLCAILFLQQDTRNEIVPLTDRKERWKRLLATLIKPMVTAEWWRKELDVLEQIVSDVPCYIMRFDKSGEIIRELKVLSTLQTMGG
jgi:hypothetical protein